MQKHKETNKEQKNNKLEILPESYGIETGGEGGSIVAIDDNIKKEKFTLALSLIIPVWLGRYFHMAGFWKVYSPLGNPYQNERIKLSMLKFLFLSVVGGLFWCYLMFGVGKKEIPLHFNLDSDYILIGAYSIFVLIFVRSSKMIEFKERVGTGEVAIILVIIPFLIKIIFLFIGFDRLEFGQKNPDKLWEYIFVIVFYFVSNLIMNIWGEKKARLPDRTEQSLHDYIKTKKGDVRLNWDECKFSDKNILVLGAVAHHYYEVKWYSPKNRKHFFIHGDKESGAPDYMTGYLPFASSFCLDSDGMNQAIIVLCDAGKRSGIEFSPFFRYDWEALNKFLINSRQGNRITEGELKEYENELSFLPPAKGIIVADTPAKIHRIMQLVNNEILLKRISRRGSPKINTQDSVRLSIFFDEESTNSFIFKDGKNDTLKEVKIARLLADGKSHGIHMFFRSPMHKRPSTIPVEVIPHVDDLLFWYRIKFKSKQKFQITGKADDVDESPVAYYKGIHYGNVLDAFVHNDGQYTTRIRAPFISGEDSSFQIQQNMKSIHPVAFDLWDMLTDYEGIKRIKRAKEDKLWVKEGNALVFKGEHKIVEEEL